MQTMASWGLTDWRMHVWTQVVSTDYVSGVLNRSVFQPIQAHFPNVKFSNFGFYHHTDPTGVTGGPKTQLWAYEAEAIGRGVHVGTHQSRSYYGATNTTRVITTQTGGPNASQAQIDGSSFGALLFNVAMARDTYRAAPGVPSHPWIAPKYGDWEKGYSYLASGNSSTDEVNMWEENVFHVALATGATEFLWWQPGLQKPVGEGLGLFSRALKELGWVTGIDRHPSCTVAPIAPQPSDDAGGCGASSVSGSGSGVDAMMELNGFSKTFLLSGMNVECADGFQRQVYRFTPRCTDTLWCTWWTPLAGIARPKNGSSTNVGWRIGSGLSIVPVNDGVVQVAEDAVSSAGAWIIKDG